ncbi:MAG: YcnI family protein, partial [Gammaproteobacteria bacterium]|nr:YcnI family protein [Gammaproteobacteria bacterium]
IKVNAHASLEEETATAGKSHKAVLLITHGCNGSPTVSVRVRLPDGAKRTKPMPKPGWELEVKEEKLDEPYESREVTVTEDVREIHWKGGSLADNLFDEFVFRMELPEVPEKTILYFRTVQECENGEFHRWIDIPGANDEEDDLESPAPSLMVIPVED